MQNSPSRYFVPFKMLGIAVLILMVLAIVYVFIISFRNWGGISV